LYAEQLTVTNKRSIGSEEVEQVDSFVYIDFVFTEDGNCNEDIKRRLTRDRMVM